MKRRTMLLLVIMVSAVLFACTNGTKLPPKSLTETDIVTATLPVPSSGTPKDYSPLDCLAISAGIVIDSDSFYATTTGSVKASVGPIPYTQKVNNTRIVSGKEMFTEAISTSSLVNVAVQKYHENDSVLLRTGKVSGSSPKWPDDVKAVTKDKSLSMYGWTPDDYCGYILAPESIKTAVYDGINSEGLHQFTYELDVIIAAVNYQRQVRTMASASEYPSFESITITVTMDDNWVTKTMTAKEVYYISMMGMDLKCSGTLVETFYMNDVIDIPDLDFFKEHIDQEIEDDDTTEIDVSACLAGAFGPYLLGVPGYFNIDATIDNKKLNGNLGFTFNGLNNINFNVSLGNSIYIKYVKNSNNNVYFKFGETTGFLDINQFISVLKGEQSSPSESSGNSSSNILSLLMENATAKKDSSGIITVHMPLKMDNIDIDIFFHLKETKVGLTIIDLGVDASIYGHVIHATLNPCAEISFPSVEEYPDLSSSKWILEEAIKLAKAETISAVLSTKFMYNNKLAAITGNVLYSNDKAQAILSVKYGDMVINNIVVTYENDFVYFDYDKFHYKFDTSSLDNLPKINTDNIKTDGLINDISLPEMIVKLLSTDSTFLLSINDYSINLNKVDNGIEIKIDDIKTDNFSLIDTSLIVTSSTKTISSLNNQYIEIKANDIMKVINLFTNNDAFTITASADISYKDIKINAYTTIYVNKLAKELEATINLKAFNIEIKDVKIIYKDDLLYITYGNVSLKLTIEDLKNLLQKPDISYETLLAADIKELNNIIVDLIITDQIQINVSDIIYDDLLVSNLSLNVCPTTVKEINVPSSSLESDFITRITDIVEFFKGDTNYQFNLSTSIKYQDETYLIDGNIIMDVNNQAFDATFKIHNEKIKLDDLNIKYKNEIFYAKYGNVYVKLTLDDLNSFVKKDSNIDTNIDFTSIILALTNKESISIILALPFVDELVVTINNGNTIAINLSDINYQGISVNNTAITIEKTANTIEIEDHDYLDINSYTNVKEIVDLFINNNYLKATINSTISIDNNIIPIEALIYFDKVNSIIKANINVMYDKYQINANIIYKDDYLYINYGNIYLMLTTEELASFLPESSNVSIDTIDLTGIIASLTCTDSVNLSIDLSNFVQALNNITIITKKIDNKVTISISNINYNSIQVSNSLISIEPTTKQDITLNNTYLDYSFIDRIMDILKTAKEDIAINVNTTISTADATVIIDGTIYKNQNDLEAVLNLKINDYVLNNISIIYQDNFLYLSYGTINIKLSTNEIKELISEYLPSTSLESNIDIESIIKDLTMNDSLNVILSLAQFADIDDINISITEDLLINVSNITYDNININNTSLAIERLSHEIKPKADTYLDYSFALKMKDVVKYFIDNQYLNVDISTTIMFDNKPISVEANIYANILDKAIEATINATYEDINISGIKLTYINDFIYVSYGNIKVKLTIEDIQSLITFNSPDLTNVNFEEIVSSLTSDDSIDIILNLSSFLDMNNVSLNITNDSSIDISISDIEYQNIIVKNNHISINKTSKKDILVTGEYNTLAGVEELIDYAKDLMDYFDKGMSAIIDTTITYSGLEIKVWGTIEAYQADELYGEFDITVAKTSHHIIFTYIDKQIYLSYGGISIVINDNDINTIVGIINDNLNTNINPDSIKNVNIDFSQIDFSSIIKTLVLENGLKTSLEIFAFNINELSLTKDEHYKLVIKDANYNSLTINNFQATIVKLNRHTSAASFAEEIKNADIPPLTALDIKNLITQAGYVKDLISSDSIYIQMSSQIINNDAVRYNVSASIHINTTSAKIIDGKKQKAFDCEIILTINKPDGTLAHKIQFYIINNNFYCVYTDEFGGQEKLKMSFQSLIESATTVIKIFLPNEGWIVNLLEKISGTTSLDTSILDSINIGGMLGTDDLSNIPISNYLESISVSENSSTIAVKGSSSLNCNENINITLRSTGNRISNLYISNLYSYNSANRVETFDLNFDILDNDFSEIVLPYSADSFDDMSYMPDFLRQFIKTAQLRKYQMSGSLKLSVIGINAIEPSINLNIVLDENNNPIVHGTITTPVGLLTSIALVGKNGSDITTDIYYSGDGYLYLSRHYVTSKFMGIGSVDNYDTRKIKLSELSDTSAIIDQVAYIFGLTDTIKGTILDALNGDSSSSKNFSFTDIYKSCTNNQTDLYYQLIIDGEALAQDSNINDMDIKLYYSSDDYLKKFVFDLGLVNDVLNIVATLNLTINDQLTISIPNDISNYTVWTK